jgi:hypothetical protein
MTAVEWLCEKYHLKQDIEIVKEAKEMEKQQQDEFGIGFAEWITTEKSKYSILYGNQEKRFATFKKDYTPKELLEIYKKESNL